MARNTKTKQREYDEKRAGQRTRNWLAVFYPEDLPEDWRERMDELGVRWIESPVHDQDVNADGTPKKPHVHTLWIFDAVKHLEQVSGLFKSVLGESESGSIIGVATPQMCNDRSQSVRYMAHLDHPNKAQYDVSQIVGHNGADPAEVMRYSATETINMMIAMEEYIEQNGITELSDFSAAIRYDYPEWYTILATKTTTYFSAFIRSRRHKAESGTVLYKTEPIKVDENGEIIEGGDVNG